MVFRFGRFELDENRRELRLDGRVREMQPRVFDLLVYLVRNQDRVVPKEELLAAIWPNVIVTDSSIMRIVSLIRSCLLAGGERDAIRTFSRQGYRFVAELEAAPAPSAGDRCLDRAREACARGDWPGAIEEFRKVVAETRLQAPDFEQWARAALYIGQPNEAIYPLERAVAAHIQNADRLGAARAALTLANVNLEGRALPIAKGWHRRAGVFLAEETREAPEHGLHLWLAARIALFERDLPRTLELAKQAEALARRVHDPDVEVLGLVYRGHIELATGDIRRGLVHLDEAGAATLAGTVSPWVSGIVFCSVIWAYLDRGDLNRAGQWTEQFTRWVKQNAAFGAPGLCRLHRGEVMCLLGDLQKAESEIEQARELLAESARYAEGDAWRVLGEIRLLRGDVTGAESAFRQAHELGWHPLPGWALLQAERGRFAAAIRTLQRGLAEPSWADGRRRGILLAHLARFAARAGHLPLARRSLAELEQSRDLRATAGCEAAWQQATAETALAENQPERAIEALRKALAVWLEAGSRINVAHVRLRLAEILLACGDHDEADLEITSAEKAFARMGADPMVGRCRAARRKARAGARRAGA
ncbi:MAG TPA: winged helix-turn-helix domain-containing protein [Lacunisphaera sp.]|nr:winged helix-turn-helix domain-containing protein [Lacunisphaera sp.]